MKIYGHNYENNEKIKTLLNFLKDPNELHFQDEDLLGSGSFGDVYSSFSNIKIYSSFIYRKKQR